MNINKVWDNWIDSDIFAGMFSVSGEQGIIFEKCCRYRNINEKLTNNKDTAPQTDSSRLWSFSSCLRFILPAIHCRQYIGQCRLAPLTSIQ